MKVSSTEKVGTVIFTMRSTNADDYHYKSITYNIYSENTDLNLADGALINEKTGEVTLLSMAKGYLNVSKVLFRLL